MPDQLPQIEVQPPVKHWLASRTLIINAMALALLAAEAQVNVLQPLLPVNVYALVAFLLPVVNAVLRVVTTTALTAQKPGGKP